MLSKSLRCFVFVFVFFLCVFHLGDFTIDDQCLGAKKENGSLISLHNRHWLVRGSVKSQDGLEIFIGHVTIRLPLWLSGKKSACNAGDLVSIPGLERAPCRRAWQPTPVFLPGESYGQRSLASYSP